MATPNDTMLQNQQLMLRYSMALCPLSLVAV